MLKTIIIVVILVIVMGVAVQMKGTDTVYVKEDVTLEVAPEVKKEAWETDEDAIKAAQAVIRKKELQAELTGLDAEIKIKQDRRKEVAAELDLF